jgi:hypothetical protein
MRERWLTVENTQSEQAIAGGTGHSKRIPIGITLGLLLAGCISPRAYSHRVNRNACTRQHRNEEKVVSGTVADMGATSGLPSTMLVLSMLLFVRSLHVDGTGYADT